MLRVGLLNAYSTQNIGDGAIYAAFARALREIRLVSDLQELRHAPVPGIEYGPVHGRCDAYLSVGGDIFNNAREWLVTRRFVANLGALARAPGERTFVFGQSVPPSCRGLAFRALAAAMRRLSSVHVRDAESFSRLRAAGVRAELSFDTAFGLIPTADGARAARLLCDASGIEPDRSAFISLRGFSGMYAHTSDALASKLQRLAIALARRGHRPVLLLQSRVDASDDDFRMAHALVADVPEARILDLTRARGAEAWDVAAAALSTARIVVAVRFHTGILRMLSGRSAYNLHYSNKGADLVTRLGQPGASLQSFEPESAIAEIERSAERAFEITPVRSQTVADLRRACRQALGPLGTTFEQGNAHVQSNA